MAAEKKIIKQELEDYIQEKPELEPERITKLPEQPEFYKVPRRFGSIPVDELPLGCDPKEQYYKIYPRISLPFQRVDRISFGHPELELNRLFFGDNLHIMRMLPSESIDLIYIDPPFFSGRNYNVIFGDANEVRSFTDIWEGGMPGYLTWLNARLLEMKRLLKPTGSIYVHLDWHASHYVKVEMDKIFGYENFKNNIVWCYKTRQFSKRYWNKKHDDILFYTKGEDYPFNWNESGVLEQYSDSTISKYKLKDEKGYYRLCGRGIKGSPIKSAKDVDSKWEKTNPELVVRNYLAEGYAPSDYWNIDIVNQVAIERIGYPTQKPEELIKKIILASSKPGDVVADFFCGGGTTLSVAQHLNRRWIGCDISRIAIAVTADRLTSQVVKPDESKRIVQQTLKPVRDISIEYWGIYEIPALTNLTDEEFRHFVISAYNGRIATADDQVHGYKEGIPLYVGPSAQEKPLTKDHVIDFAKTILTKKGKQHGTMLAWAFTPSAQEAAAKLDAEKKVSVDFVKISLVPIESEEFRNHVTTKHKEYSDLLIFILPPEVRLKYKRIAPLTYEFDISESISLNSGGKIMNVQWDFDYKGRFASTQGYSFIRNEKGLPKLSVTYKFPSDGKKRIACKVQDDKGGEKTEIIELEAR